MQLRDVPELNCSTDGSQPTGEVYIKGNSIFKGYYKDPETTKTVLDEQGWLKVGDIGLLHKNGAVELIERVNEFKKLQNGQFIAPQRIESIYVNAPLINQIYVDVNSNYSFLVAVCTIVEEKLKQFAEVNGLEGDIQSLI